MSEVTRSAAQRRARIKTGSLKVVSPKRPPARRRHPRAPGVLLLLAPLFVAGGAIGLSAAHAALGAPLGARFAGELWDITRSLCLMLVGLGPFSVYAHRANAARAATELPPPAADPRAIMPGVQAEATGQARGDDAGGSKSGGRRWPAAPPGGDA